jgi:O-antigen ligase
MVLSARSKELEPNVSSRLANSILVGVAVLSLLLAGLAYSRPGYFANPGALGEVLLIEAMIVALTMYRRIFFPILIVVFLLAGVDLPVGGIWTVARWFCLCLGGLAGVVIVLKDRRLHFGVLHVFASFAVLAAFVSAAVSHFPAISSLKALSLLLLFLYSATGARLAVLDRENRFFPGLILGCEILVGALAVAYLLLGMEPMGNPNSLGAVMGVVAAPVLLWGSMVATTAFARRRLFFMFGLCMYLTYFSHARAAIGAAVISCGVLCLGLRQYKLLFQGVGFILILMAASAIVQPQAFSSALSRLNSDVVHKGHDQEHGVLASRDSPWRDSMESIRNHFWFGVGFGTSDTGQDASEHLGRFSSETGVTREHGSSYLAITTWVGVLGVLPFLLLVFVLGRRIVRTVFAMLRTQNAFNPAVPLAMVVLAGLIHAALEDWLFAPGYYLCVFFWSMAFVFWDFAPSAALVFPSLVVSRPIGSPQQIPGGIPSIR